MEERNLKRRLYFKTMLLLLIPAFLMIVIGYLILPKDGPYYNNVTGEEAKILIENYPNRVLIIDVRTPEEFDQGHIPNAKNIPENQLELKLSEIQSLARGKNYILVVCRSGNRSATASQYLAEQKIGEILNLDGGMLEWDYEIETTN